MLGFGDIRYEFDLRGLCGSLSALYLTFMVPTDRLKFDWHAICIRKWTLGVIDCLSTSRAIIPLNFAWGVLC